MAGRAVAATLVAVAAAVAGCGSSPEPDQRVRPAWAELTFPVPPGEPGRVVLRDAAACAGRWYVVGGVASAGGATRPAAWGSGDGRTWTPLVIAAESYYGRQNVLHSVACRDGRAAAVGAKSGGAHGNPRVSTWYQRPDDALAEVPAEFELYGGPRAVNVSRIAGGPAGWLIAGARVGGAAVWASADATRFRIVEDAPELATDPRGRTSALDALAVPDGWLVAGGLIAEGRFDTDAIGWVSSDAAGWRRVGAPGSREQEELQRLAAVDGKAFAAGVRGKGFGVWERDGDRWTELARFGATAGSGVPAVRGLAAARGRLVAATFDGAAHAVWVSRDAGRSWRMVAAPGPMAGGPDSAAGAAAGDSGMLLVVDDGRAGRGWWSAWGDGVASL